MVQKTQKTLISHFYNEEYLLPFWIRHHLPLFDNAILIDWASTDASVGIIRELAPHWKVVPSKHKWFSAANADGEIMEYERSLPGWKMALCTTEFLLIDDLDGYCKSVEDAGLMGFVAFGRSICDTYESRKLPVHFDVPMLRQRHWGLEHSDLFIRKDRMMHRWGDGNYTGGRHSTLHPHDRLLMGYSTAFCAWLALAPYDQTKERKLQIQKRVPESSFAIGDSVHHRMTERQLEDKFEYNAVRARNLFDEPSYGSLVEKLPKRYYP